MRISCTAVTEILAVTPQSISNSPPKICAPNLNASATVEPAPSCVGFASRQALRCSSDRKKLINVQSESSALLASSPRFPNQTITPSASGPVPFGVTANFRGSPQWWQDELISTDSPIIGAKPSASVAQH